jgi:hypothetical protein
VSQPPDYERPPLRRRFVAPLWVLTPPYVLTFALVTTGLEEAGVRHWLAVVAGSGLAILAQGSAELWWRRTTPPEYDPPPRRFLRKLRAGRG